MAQIETGLHGWAGRAITNFNRTLTTPHSELAGQIEDPSSIEFSYTMSLWSAICTGDCWSTGGISRVIGYRVAFVGSNYLLEIKGEDFYLDMLFYHLRLRYLVVVELKTGEFSRRDAGKLNFYLPADDDLLCHPHDNATIGILLCREKNRVVWSTHCEMCISQ